MGESGVPPDYTTPAFGTIRLQDDVRSHRRCCGKKGTRILGPEKAGRAARGFVRFALVQLTRDSWQTGWIDSGRGTERGNFAVAGFAAPPGEVRTTHF